MASTVAPETVSAGGAWSATVTVSVPVALFPALSVAVHVTVVAPTGKVLPLGTSQLGETAPSTRSSAVAV